MEKINLKLNLVGLVNDKQWSHYLFTVLLENKEVFQYKVGIGHAVSGPDFRSRKKVNPDLKGSHVDGGTKILVWPDNETILNCLFSDAHYGELNFLDFCGEFGYSKDSISALKTHCLCSETREKLIKLFGPKYAELSAYYLSLEL